MLVTDAKPSTASLVTEAAELLRTVGPPLTLVVNRMPSKGAEIDLDGLDALIPDAQGLVCVDEDQHGATRVASGDFALGRRARELESPGPRARGRPAGRLAAARPERVNGAFMRALLSDLRTL